MFVKVMAVLLIVGLVFWAVRSRVFLKRLRRVEQDSTVSSPASIALAELVAVAGGVYLSLVLVTSFLKLSVPNKVTVLSMPLDPVALFAIAIALLQPIGTAVYYRLVKK